MPRIFARSLQIVLDSFVLSIAYWFAFLFRFEFHIPPTQINSILINWPYVIVLQYSFLSLFGVPLMSWRYMTMRDTVRVLLSVTASSTVLVLIRVVLEAFTS